jgi:putative FmdB family regulatory protein
MPLYEYSCRPCGRTFEALVRASEQPTCPACGSAELTRLMSVVAIGGRREEAAPAPRPMGACGTCGDPRGPGSCAAG